MADFIYNGKGIRTIADVQRANQQKNLENQLIQAQVEKSKQLDVDKLGEIGFMKAAMGQQLTPQEEAAALFVDAKSGGIMFNPATGAIEQKPRISDKIGLGRYIQPQQGLQGQMPSYTGSNNPPSLPAAFDIPNNEFDLKYEEQIRKAAGNPKLQQALKEKYAKDKMDFDESQSKAVGFADRVKSAESVFSKPEVLEAGLSPLQRVSGATPLIGNYLVSDAYQQFDQAQRDFVNAVLRRESGAVIGDQEFDNARKQYLPQPGDSQAVLEQKRRNRENALSGLVTSAGAGYSPAPDLYQRGEAEFNSKKKTINWEDLP